MGQAEAHAPGAGLCHARVPSVRKLRRQLDEAFAVRRRATDSGASYEHGAGILAEVRKDVFHEPQGRLTIRLRRGVPASALPAFLREIVPGAHVIGGLFLDAAE